MRIAITGAKGQLGAALVNECRNRHDDVTALDRSALDVRNGRAVADMIDRLRPDVLVNCTGYNTVDAAEDHPLDALALNAFAVRSLARAANAVGAALVHYSTDFVFDGIEPTPRTETDPPNPKSVYATSKLLGEWFAADVPRHYVLRVESLFGQAAGGPQPKGSVASIVDALIHGRAAKVLIDRVVSPTFIADAAFATRELLERDASAGTLPLRELGPCDLARLCRRSGAAARRGTPLRHPPLCRRSVASGASSILCVVECEACGGWHSDAVVAGRPGEIHRSR